MSNKNKAQKSSKKKVNEEVHEPVAKCDQSEEVVANCDHLENGDITLSQNDIETQRSRPHVHNVAITPPTTTMPWPILRLVIGSPEKYYKKLPSRM